MRAGLAWCRWHALAMQAICAQLGVATKLAVFQVTAPAKVDALCLRDWHQTGRAFRKTHLGRRFNQLFATTAASASNTSCAKFRSRRPPSGVAFTITATVVPLAGSFMQAN